MRLHIFGASGSGVPTLGQHLSQQLGLSYFDTDADHWVPTYPPLPSDDQPQSATLGW